MIFFSFLFDDIKGYRHFRIRHAGWGGFAGAGGRM